jgi:hypothetical protein
MSGGALLTESRLLCSVGSLANTGVSKNILPASSGQWNYLQADADVPLKLGPVF